MASMSPPQAGQTAPSAPSADSRPGPALPAPDEKHLYVQSMFDQIAPRYDLLNSVLSARLHYSWRRAAVREANLAPGASALDVCTGTGDFAFALAERVGASGEVVGCDFSRGMLALADAKQAVRSYAANLRFEWADAQELPYPDNRFDAATVGFGIRNVADIERGLDEMARVVKPGGRVVLLEFSQPQNPVVARLYGWYSFHVLPRIGGLISGRRAAYEYLPSSVKAFHSREALADLMRRAGLTDIKISNLTFGTVVIHRGTKS